MKNKIKYLNLLFFLIGLGLFVFILKDIDYKVFLKRIKQMKWGLAAVFSIHGFLFVLQSLSWWLCINHDKSSASFIDIYLAKVAGWTMGEITPFSTAASETFKGFMINKKMESSAVVSSLLIYNTVHAFVTFSLLLTGIILLFILIKVALIFKLIVISAVLLITAGFILLIRQQHKGILAPILLFLMKIKFLKKKLRTKIQYVRDIDNQIEHFWKKKKINFIFAYIFQWGAKLIEALELFIILYFLSYSISFITAIFLFSVTSLIFIITFFIPSQIGFVEGGMNRTFKLIGLNPVYGTLMAVVRRIRVLLWISAGLLIMLIKNFVKSKTKKKNEIPIDKIAAETSITGK